MAVPQLTFQRSTHYEDALGRAAAECGIDFQYWDIFGHNHLASVEALKSIVTALGWDTSSADTIDEKRARMFTSLYTASLQPTIVVGDSERFIPLTLPGNTGARVSYEITLESGERVAGELDTAHLPLLREVHFEEKTWSTFQLPISTHVPLGYHQLVLRLNEADATVSNLIVCPDRAYLPEKLANGGKTAGFNVALYGLRSKRNWGCGDFTDLRALLDWSMREVGFSFVGVNPLHALHNRTPYNTSPYLPLSVYYKNLIYLDIEKVPEFAGCGAATALFHTDDIQKQIQALRDSTYVEYQGVDAIKKRFLRLLHDEFRAAQSKESARGRAFAKYCEREGDLLHKFALYCALDQILHEEDGNRWTWLDWPIVYQSPDSPESKQFADKHAVTVEFYKYVQFVIDEQLCGTQRYAKEIGMPIGLYHDLAVATDSCGADLWAHRAFFVHGCRVGAPPDDFSPKGQDWGFPPPNVLEHRATGYVLYRESIRKILQAGGALRIDHVMRLFRLFWIPAGMEAQQGTYVRDNAVDLMRILALESVRCANVIIGEDLGTVTDEIRTMLAQYRILSYRLFYFEKNSDFTFKHSSAYPVQALVASTTHDLPTLAGFWLNRDIEARRAAGLADDEGYRNQIADRQREKQRMLDALHFERLLPDTYERDASKLPELNGDLHNAVIGFLMNVPSMVLLINQEDFTKETEQQNLPGSTAQYPNWQRKMRYSIEDLASEEAKGYSLMFKHQLARTGRCCQ
jgi:4-alpha-glucanotransferase